MLALAIEFIADAPMELAHSLDSRPLGDGVPSASAAGYAGGPRNHRFGGHSGGETPGPIPNPEVKPSSADGTALEAGWESRSPPGHSISSATERWRC